MTLNQPKTLHLFAGLLLILNLLQSYFTELIYDEAYYWYYAQDMAWGYFDHPPMVALLIAAGEIFANGELGVRFVSCLLSVATFYLIWACIDHKDKIKYVIHFCLLYFSVTLLNAYGFFTLPDTPLLFFLALFLWTYGNFVRDANWQWSLLLGFCMAMMMYSKYHAALIIIFVLLSNISLIRNKFAWLALFISLLLYSPHLYWLYENDFISVVYHIYERPNRAYEFGDFTAGFFINLIVLFGLTFPWMYRALYLSKNHDLFTKALTFITYGFIIFFFISSFSRRIQTQWLIAISIPMLILAFRHMISDETSRRWLFRTALVNGILLLYLRVGLAYAPLFPIHYESHGNKNWVQEIVNVSGEQPVIFENSYRQASMFQFYSGEDAYSLNNIWYRHNQYSIDQSEQKIQDTDVLFLSRFLKEGEMSFTNPDGSGLKGIWLKDFESFRKLNCKLAEDSDKKKIRFYLINPYSRDVSLDKLEFAVGYLNPYKQVLQMERIRVEEHRDKAATLLAGDSLLMKFELPEPPDNLDLEYFKISISDNGLPFGLNGNNIKLAD